MAVGVLDAELIQAQLDRLDAAVDITGLRSKRGLRCRTKPERRFLALNLAARCLESLLEHRDLQPDRLDLGFALADAVVVATRTLGQQREITLLEACQLGLQLTHPPFVLGFLLFKELRGRVLILAHLAKVALHEDGQQGFDNQLGQVRRVVFVTDGVEIFARRAFEGDLLFQVFDYLVLVGFSRRLQIEIGHAHDLLQIRPAQQCPRHQEDFLLSIAGIDGDTLQQRAQYRRCVDEDTGRCLVLVRQFRHHRPADNADGPGYPKHPPTETPGSPGVPQQKDDYIMHP